MINKLVSRLIIIINFLTAKSYKNSRTWYKTIIQIFVREFYEHPSVNFHLPLQLFLCLQGLWNSLKHKYATFVQSTALTILMHWLTFSQSYLFHKCLKMPRPIPANFRAFTLFYNGANLFKHYYIFNAKMSYILY